jgi:hypothetical protein
LCIFIFYLSILQPHNYLEETKDETNYADKMHWPERRVPSPTLEDIEVKLEAEHYLARAKQLQLEQEDEVKLANKVILATKCQAIRDAQLEEKQRIQFSNIYGFII